MGLNNIELPVSVLADLYQNALVDTGKTTASKEVVLTGTVDKKEPVLKANNAIAWSSLGNNQKNILIIVKNDEAVYLPDNELAFLTGILNACKLSLADVAIVNLAGHPEGSYKTLTHFFKSRVVFLFDIDPVGFGLPISFPHYQLQAHAGNTFLYSPSLKELENDKVEKSKLWVCLKRLFNL